MKETSPERDRNLQLSSDPAIEDLSRKMLSYSRLWFGTSENDDLAEERFQCGNGFCSGWRVALVAMLTRLWPPKLKVFLSRHLHLC